MRMLPIPNVISVDVEGFVESNLQSFPIPRQFSDERAERYEVERNLDAILELLDEVGVRATFFFVGTVARRTPRLVSNVSRLGHEVGSHSYEHLRVFGVGRDEFRERLRESMHMLEDLAGAAVHGFRAPDFSITRASLWALEVLKDLGFSYDSSVYPFGFHDVYGIDGARPTIHVLPNGLVEFPLPTVSMWGRRLPFGGGGYFRLYPLRLTEALIRATNKAGDPCMLYIHPYEIGPVVPQVPVPATRRFRHYANIRRVRPRLRRLLDGFRFAPAIDVLRERELVAARTSPGAGP